MKLNLLIIAEKNDVDRLYEIARGITAIGGLQDFLTVLSVMDAKKVLGTRPLKHILFRQKGDLATAVRAMIKKSGKKPQVHEV